MADYLSFQKEEENMTYPDDVNRTRNQRYLINVPDEQIIGSKLEAAPRLAGRYTKLDRLWIQIVCISKAVRCASPVTWFVLCVSVIEQHSSTAGTKSP